MLYLKNSVQKNKFKYFLSTFSTTLSLWYQSLSFTAMASSSSTLNHGTSSSSRNYSIIINPGHHLTVIKLTDNNYLTWKLQILNTIYGHSLENHILSDSKPEKMRLTSVEVERNTKNTENDSERNTNREDLIENPKYISWMRQDRLICSWLMGSMNEDTVTQMIGCNTTREIWLTLEQTYSSSNTAKIMQLKGQLQNLKKGNQSIRDYTAKVKNLVSALKEVGCLISLQEHTIYILSGLGSEYDPIVSAIFANPNRNHFKKLSHF